MVGKKQSDVPLPTGKEMEVKGEARVQGSGTAAQHQSGRFVKLEVFELQFMTRTA